MVVGQVSTEVRMVKVSSTGSLLAGQTAVVTGGAQGLGFAIAELFIAEGARVVLGDVNLDATQKAAQTLGGDRGDDVVRAVRCDVTSSQEVDALVAAAVDGFGGLDIMVNNAGITRDATMRKMTEDQFDQVIAVHLKGTWNGLRSAAAIMRENKSGAIINMSSISGKVGMVGQTNYSAAKAGEPEEVAKVALFLASDLSSYMTGTVMEVTGGRHL
jgi:3-oxoacyl-[acyl-carrier protein] reductase